jgi:hypothetical protein
LRSRGIFNNPGPDVGRIANPPYIPQGIEKIIAGRETMKDHKMLLVTLVAGLLLALAVAPAPARGLPAAGSGGEARQAPADLLIVTPREFEPVLAPLVAFKNATGLPTVLITLEEIEADPAYTGDQAAQVKQAIAAYEDESGIQYVMLVGDVDRFPVRWVAAKRGGDVEYFYASDLYYADLYDATGAFHTWDSDGDGLYGEHVASGRCAEDPYSVNLDRVDLHPDVAVGRMPASTREELESYVARVIRYEYLAFGADWFHNVLLYAGGGRTGSRYCDPGIHFSEVQSHLDSAFGTVFTYRTWIHESYYRDEGEETGRPCVCQAGEPLLVCLGRTLLLGTGTEALEVFDEAERWGRAPGLPRAAPVAEFEDVGFLAWHDHNSLIRGYVTDVNNADRLSVAFADGCGDGNFAGPAVGSVGRFSEPYVTADGHSLQVRFEAATVDETTYYHITGCDLDGRSYGLDGAHCAGGIYPAMTFADDFGLDASATIPVGRDVPYVLNPPPPAPVQPADWENNPEIKLFARFDATGQETGWVSMVGATKGATFPNNGVLLQLFFQGYADPDASVAPRNRLGDAWRSMVERWLDVVFDASGNFSLDYIYDTFHIDRDGCSSASFVGLQHAMMYALHGDPSLRIGGIDLAADTSPPVTTDDDDGAWHNHPVEVTLTAVDAGSPPSGVRATYYRVGATGDWETGTRFSIAAPSDHSNDGVRTVEYYSEDFFDNVEAVESTRVRIDTAAPETTALLDGTPARAAPAGAVPPSTGPVTLDPIGAQQGLLFFSIDDIIPERSCYNVSVEVTLEATDYRSEVASTSYRLDRGGLAPQTYTGPFSISAWDLIPVVRTLEYWSEDNAGNVERPHALRLCVTNVRAGLMRDEIRILAALEEIIAMQMRQDLASTLPPIKGVGFEYQFRDEPDAQWTPIATDLDGQDGWGAEWKTIAVPNGDYGIRMTVWGFPPREATEPQADPVLYQEEVGVTVSNIPATDYLFELMAWPDSVDRGQTVEYTLQFVNQTDGPLTNLAMTCDLDPGYFEQLDVLDGGTLDQHGMPTWSLAKLESGETWKAHVNGKTSTAIVPGTVVATQAFLTADTIPLLLSDDPATPALRAGAQAGADWTAVTVNLVDGSISGQVRDAFYGTPISASVTVAGPVSRVLATGPTGHYAAADLPPGTYTVGVQAPGYDYQSPAGPVAVTLDGMGEDVQASFHLARADTIPPVSALHQSADDVVLSHSTVISGTAYDYPPGSGVHKVELNILRAADQKYWNGTGWVEGETWLLASGTAAWTVDCAGITWDDGASYTIRSRATDKAGNVEKPTGSSTTPDLPAPSLIAPADGTLVEGTPTFRWSLVLESRYRIQIDDDAGFPSPEVDASELDLNTFTPLRLAPGTHYWRVQAADPNLGYPESEWSQVWTVTIQAEIYLPLIVRTHSAPLYVQETR